MSRIKELLDNPFPEANLSPQQFEMVKLYGRGYRPDDIAKKKALKVDSVRLYLRKAGKKIGIPWHKIPLEVIKRIENAYS
jgi:DNA-binding CsgD family transcriptional regulator